jgi:hypothetical protein
MMVMLEEWLGNKSTGIILEVLIRRERCRKTLPYPLSESSE